jgi:hypothetical protein
MLARPRNPLVVETVEITPDAPDAFLMSGKSSSQ